MCGGNGCGNNGYNGYNGGGNVAYNDQVVVYDNNNAGYNNNIAFNNNGSYGNQRRIGNGCAVREIVEPCCQRIQPRVEVRYERGRGGGCGCRRQLCGCERRTCEPARVVNDCCGNNNNYNLPPPPGRRHPGYPGVVSKLLNPYGKRFYQTRGYDSSINVDYED